jgi:hypothetical protein
MAELNLTNAPCTMAPNMPRDGDKSDYKSGKLCMIMLPHDGHPRVVKVEGPRPYPWTTSETKVLLQTTEDQEPGDELFVQLVCDDNGMFTQKDKPNKHVVGLLGDCFIMCVIDSTPPEPKNEDEEWPDESFRMGERIPHKFLPRVLSTLAWKQNVMFSPFHGYFHHVLGEAVRKYEVILETTNANPRQLTNIIWECLRTMQHPHIECTTIAAGMMTPSHPDIMIKSKAGLLHAIDNCFFALQHWAAENGANQFLSLQHDSIPDEMPEELPHPSLTCDEIGHKLTPYYAALHENYFRRLDTLAQSEADAERRKREAERREKEEAAKRAAEQAKKAQRLLEERIARLEAEANRPYTKSGAQKLPQKGSTSRARTKEEQAVHDHHVSEEDKARRTAVWEAKQELAHLTAETKRLEKAYTDMRDEEKRQGAAAALRNQVVPGKATMGSFVPGA